jgi:hypothetical protein
MSQILIELLRDAPFLRGGTIFRGADMDDPNLNTQKLQTEPLCTFWFDSISSTRQ